MAKAPVARVYQGTPAQLRFLAQRLRAGEVVAVPTETVYGLAGNALDQRACRRIFRAKGRPLQDPLIVHIHTLGQLEQIAVANEAALRLAQRFWPGPLTIVLPKKPVVPAIVSAGLPSVAIRMPRHPLFRRLLKAAALPLAAPSANRFGYVSPTTAEHVRQGLGKKIRYILDGGTAQIGLESTIVDLRDPSRPRLLRPGAITREMLEGALGRRVRDRPRGSQRISDGRAQVAPGLLARHYSPRTPVVLHRKLQRPGNSAEAYVYWRRPRGPKSPNVYWLDNEGDMPRAGRRLFALLRELDLHGYARLHIELAPTKGLGVAINDRLRRAAAR